MFFYTHYETSLPGIAGRTLVLAVDQQFFAGVTHLRLEFNRKFCEGYEQVVLLQEPLTGKEEEEASMKNNVNWSSFALADIVTITNQL